MAFIERMVGPDERLVGIARLHWIYGVKGLAWLGGMIMLGTVIDWTVLYLLGASAGNPALGGIVTLGNAGFWICLTIGAWLFLFYFIMLLATEVGLTTKRLIYKRGLIMVRTEGLDLEEIKGADVDNEILGRFLNYGSIHFDARFIGDMELPSIANPYQFVKALNDQRSQLKEMGTHIMLEGRGAALKPSLAHRLNMIEPGDAPQQNVLKPVESTPILISELKEDVLEDFEDSSHPKS